MISILSLMWRYIVLLLIIDRLGSIGIKGVILRCKVIFLGHFVEALRVTYNLLLYFSLVQGSILNDFSLNVLSSFRFIKDLRFRFYDSLENLGNRHGLVKLRPWFIQTWPLHFLIEGKRLLNKKLLLNWIILKLRGYKRNLVLISVNNKYLSIEVLRRFLLI